MYRYRNSCWILFFVLFIHAIGSWARPAAVVTVGAVAGKLSVRRNGAQAFTPLAPRQSLWVGDIVRTGANSKATILFPDGAQVRLNANSSIQIIQSRAQRGGNQNLFRALAGQVWARLRPGNAIETRTAALGVLGTEIHLEIAEDDTTILTVNEGSVDFYNAFGAVVVGAKQQSTARPGAAPTRPVTVENAGFILEWTFDLNRVMIPREKFFISPDPQIVKAELARHAAQLQQTPDQPIAHRNYGDALFDSGNYQAAHEQYEIAARLATGETSLLIRQGYALLELGHLEAAESTLRGALATANGATTQLAALDNTQPPDEAGDAPAALVALADLKLTRDQPVEAQNLAQNALTQSAASWRPTRAEAHLALGISLLRQSDKTDDAISAFRNVLDNTLTAYHYQAHSWLAMALLAKNETGAALQEAQTAVRLMPRSGLARGNLALVHFYSGNLREARREADLSLELNPDSVAARVALGQVLLAQGEVDEANKVAAQAVALDEELPQARYLLGVADAGRRDYRHAALQLQKAVELAPNDVPSLAALARTYTLMGRNQEAEEVLQEALPRQRQSELVLAALGDVYYQQGRYDQAATQYREAIGKNSGSALYQANLARTLLVSNRLQDAIIAAQRAVYLAPNIGQYHAILGMAYQFSNMPSQAEREFRDALILDPHNALALIQLSYRHSAGDLRPAAAGFAQGFLLDPAISQQLLRGGVHTELAPSIGERGNTGFDFSHRSLAASGKINTFGFATRNADSGTRDNDESRQLDISEHITFLPGNKTTLYSNLRVQRQGRGLAGPLSNPDSDDDSRFDYGQAQIAMRQRLQSNSHLWFGIFGNASRNNITDAALNSFFDPLTGLPIPTQRFTSRALQPEVRWDYDFNRDVSRSSRFTLGAALANTRFRSVRSLQQSPNALGSGVFAERDQSILAYSQLTQQVGHKLSLTAQLRVQRLGQEQNALVTLPSGGSSQANAERTRTHILPNLMATYNAGRSTSLRFLFSDRLTDITGSTFAPGEVLLTTERSVLPFGIPERTRLTQLEIQHRTGSRSFLKAFAFHTSANNVQIGFSDLLGFGGGLPAAGAPGLQIDKWRGSGVGARYEQPLTRNLFLNLGATLRRTNSSTSGLGTNFTGSRAPYEPKYLGHANLNYVDGKGNKMGIGLRHQGWFFQDTPLALQRQRFAGQTYVDLLLAKEPSVGSEFYINISNLFNRSQIQFNDFPVNKRRINFGIIRRY